MKCQKIVCALLLIFLAGGGVFGDTAPETPYAVNTNLSRSGWDAEGWRITARSPSNYAWDNGTLDEGCDFTVFQADDGTWQLIGCVRNTSFLTYGDNPQPGRILFHWETTNFFSSDWTEKGVFLTTDDLPPDVPVKWNQGLLQAPHMVKDGELYYLIYNSANAHLMVSTNGKDWAHQAASDGSHTLFEINGGRDIMLVDNRDVDGKWYAVYCGKSNWASTGNTNFYHSATNIIGPWSGPLPMATRDHWRDVESPFIVRRGGWYYLILQDQVRAEPCITNFFDLPVHADLGTYSESPRWGYAPEIIHHPSGQDYLASYNDADGEAWEGMEIRPMYWKLTDTDDDGLPDSWETQYYGGATNAAPLAWASNNINTVEEAYIAGIDPTNPASFFVMTGLAVHSPSVISWGGVSGRVYAVSWTSNLLSSFQTLETNLSWMPGVFTDLTHTAEMQGFYKIEVELEQ